MMADALKPVTKNGSSWLKLGRAFSSAIVLGVSLLAAPLATAQILPDPNQGPGGPILVATATTSPHSTFYAEILRSEGLNAFTVVDVNAITPATLSGYDIVVLSSANLSASQATVFSDWVNAGGNLIAMRPDPDLFSLMGIAAGGPSLSNGYVLIDTTATSPGAGLTAETMQFFGLSDRYTLDGASEVARLFTNETTGTTNPAVTIRNVGTLGGTAIAYSYELATSIVYARQGNPAWSGQERDGIAPIRSDDLYYGNSATDPQSDWVNLNKAHIPQADEQQRLLANLIIHANQNRKPLPRFWYFPRGEKAVVIMTGDDHANNGTQGRFDQFIQMSPTDCSVEDWECVRGTSYIYPYTPLSDSAAATFTNLGFEVGLHLSTNCGNFDATTLATFYSQQTATFATNFPSVPALSTQRHHCIAWSDWATGAKVQFDNGMRLDTTYYYYPPGWVLNREGFFTGSGMPMRFSDLDGSLIDVYQAATQMTDESGQSYPYTVDTLLDRALGSEGYYGAFTANMHTDVPQIPQSDAIVNSALARGVPIVSSKQMLDWLDGRNNSSFTSINWSGDTLTFGVQKDIRANGIQANIPFRTSAGVVTAVTRDGLVVAFTSESIKGVDYAVFDAQAGNYIVVYQPDTTAPTIVTNDPSDGSADVSRLTSVSADFSESLDPASVTSSTFSLRDAAGATVPGSLNYDSVARRVTFTPYDPLGPIVNHIVTVLGGTGGIADASGNPLAASASWSFTTGTEANFTAWTPSDAPAVSAENDPAATEVGVKFTVDVDGFINGVRFYKGIGNTGTHVGNLWDSNGLLLDSAVFTGETTTGWQQVNFASPVAVQAGTVYVASYHAPNGRYASDVGYFIGTGVDAGPVNLLEDGISNGNGVYNYNNASIFPSSSIQGTNYWVDVVFTYTIAPDVSPPSVIFTVPTTSQTDVAITTDVQVAFSEAIDFATLTNSTFDLRDSSATVVASSLTYDSATRLARLTPQSPLAFDEAYTAVVRGGPAGVADLAGNAMSADYSWTFFTSAPDTTSPTVTATTPVDGSVDVGSFSNVTATFSETLDATTVNATTFELRDAGGALVAATVSYDGALSVATLTPGAALAASTTYTATLRGGASGVRDSAGNALAADLSWTFTTGSEQTYSAWISSATPSVPAENDPNPVELGVKFTVDFDGFITSIRFYKGAGNTGTHVGNLWTVGGQQLATATFVGETASGWQQVNFATPVAVSAGQVYVASYHAPNGNYAVDGGYFAVTGVDAGPVNLLQDGISGGNGVYSYSGTSTFPTSTWNSSNYWVDVVYVANVADTTPPTVTATNPATGGFDVSTATTVTATFSETLDATTVNATTFELRDAGGALVAATVSYDGALSVATLTPGVALVASTTYTATVRGGAGGVRDSAGNALAANMSWTFTTGLGQTYSAWSLSATPAVPAENDPNAVELGVKFTVDFNGFISGIRFYKGSSNIGTHVGNLWTASGQLLATATFVGETASGWQQVNFASPVAVTIGQVYVASYHAPNGNYAVDGGYFAIAGVDAGPVNLLQDGISGGNGVYSYSGISTFPTSTWNASNYWVDVVFLAGVADTTPPTVTATTPVDGSVDVGSFSNVTATFSETLDATTVNATTFVLRDAGGALVAATVSYDGALSVATLTPGAPLAASATYTATVQGGVGGVRDSAGNALAASMSWTFTTASVQTYSAWSPSATPAVPAENDPNAVELGVKFTVDFDGFISGIRFYKGAGNTGTHVGNLWTVSGQLLATATFVGETASGWQQVNFASPVAVTIGQVYVASYHAPNGNYAVDGGYFAIAGVDAGPVNLLQDGISGGNGVYSYSGTSTFPTSTWNSSNYWVDVVFSQTVVDTTPPTVTATTPADSSFDVSTATTVTATFSETLDATTVNATTFELRDAGGALVAATVSYDGALSVATLTPDVPFSLSTAYTASISGGPGGIRDVAGNPLAADVSWSFATEAVASTCGSPANAIVAENCLPGNPQSEWDISGAGDTSIQGFATDISVDKGDTVGFKITTDATNYTVDIYRIGYYDGAGARLIATVVPSASLPQSQPECLEDTSTGLIDCGNWSASASWVVPTTATSGIYFAKLTRADTGGASHIVFVVRDDSGTSDILFQTADTTWQAYNNYGGNSLYTGAPAGRAYKVSYNRPFTTRSVDGGQDWVFNAEYPMVRWLEANGYDVSYFTGVDTDRLGALLLNHKMFLSIGHDEYWSAAQRSNVEAARDAGIHLAFFSGNEIFWKTRWETAIDGSGQTYRTLVCYKETSSNGFIDPQSPPGWTGTWRDPRFSPPGDGGRPENALTGTMFRVNAGGAAIQVPAADGKLRFWRNTSVANLADGATATLAGSTLGYEWDEVPDNEFRPAGLMLMSSTTVNNVQVLLDYGSTYGIGSATHNLTLYRHAGGALVFGAGTIQWSWGLDGNHDLGGSTPDVRMQQATVNLFADMTVQPASIRAGLVAASASTDLQSPTSSISTPAVGSSIPVASPVTISGGAVDSGGGVVAAIEVSVDGGASWRPATGREAWSYTWTPVQTGPVTILARSVDDSGNIETAGPAINVTVN